MNTSAEDYRYCLQSLKKHPMFKWRDDSILESLLKDFTRERFENNTNFFYYLKVTDVFMLLLVVVLKPSRLPQIQLESLYYFCSQKKMCMMRFRCYTEKSTSQILRH